MNHPRFTEDKWLTHVHGGLHTVLTALLLFAFTGCTCPRTSDFCGPGEPRFCLPDEIRQVLERVDQMEAVGDFGPASIDGPRYLVTRNYLGACHDFQTQISRTIQPAPGLPGLILIAECLRKDSPFPHRDVVTFLVPSPPPPVEKSP